MGLTQIFRSRFKQSRISPHNSDSYVLGCSVNSGGIFGYIWGYKVFLKGLETFMEMGNLEDLMLF